VAEDRVEQCVGSQLVDRASVTCCGRSPRRAVERMIDRDCVRCRQHCVQARHPIRQDPRPAHATVGGRRGVPAGGVSKIHVDQGRPQVATELAQGA
jgi:hypothetical protein